ncbi:MAG TPA: hypothetical protein VHC43_03320 [Mycobacteriales bacterium]|nr:hypothetical protein [Mycobacteriales bacterium]
MGARYAQSVVRRAPLPLTETDIRAVEALRVSGPQRAALMRLLPEDLPSDISESGLLHALFEVALSRVREEVEAAGYAELALQQDDTVRRRAARRRRPRWSDDA